MAKYLDLAGLEHLWGKIKALLEGKVDKVSGKGLSTNDLTAALKNQYDAAYTHSQAAHAPANAERNVVAGVQVNGADLAPDAATRKVNVAVPTGALASKSKVAEADLDTALAAKVNASASANHSHTNKAVLDELTQDDLDKLDGIEAGATKTIVDAALDAASANPVQNKAVKAALDGKAAAGHTHTAATTSAPGFMAAADKTKLDGIAAGANNYTHPTAAGFKHLPAGGASGQILRWSADGAAVWGADNNTTYTAMKGATASAAGAQGLVPAPAAGKQASFLRGDGTWVVPTDTKYNVATASANGLMAAADKAKLDAFGAAGTYALKTEIAGVYKYKGSVASVAKLPTGGTAGDVYNVEDTGMNYAWDGTKWDALGQLITIEGIANAEIDAIILS